MRINRHGDCGMQLFACQGWVEGKAMVGVGCCITLSNLRLCLSFCTLHHPLDCCNANFLRTSIAVLPYIRAADQQGGIM